MSQRQSIKCFKGGVGQLLSATEQLMKMKTENMS